MTGIRIDAAMTPAHSDKLGAVANFKGFGRAPSAVGYCGNTGEPLAEMMRRVGSVVTPMKGAHLDNNPYMLCNFWDGVEVYDTCTAECHAELLLDARGRREGWERFKSTPPPVGYDPATIPQWADGPDSPAWGVLRLQPWHLRVSPGEFGRSGAHAAKF